MFVSNLWGVSFIFLVWTILIFFGGISLGAELQRNVFKKGHLIVRKVN